MFSLFFCNSIYWVLCLPPVRLQHFYGQCIIVECVFHDIVLIMSWDIALLPYYVDGKVAQFH